MKKLIAGTAIAVASIFALAGCDDPSANATLTQGTAVASNQPVQPVSKGTYASGDVIFNSLQDIDGYDDEYLFGGFNSDNHFVIDMLRWPNSNGASNITFYFTLTPNMTFVVPHTKTVLKVIGFNVKNNTIQLEQMN